MSKLWNYEEVEWVNTHLDGSDKLLHFNRTINYYSTRAISTATSKVGWTGITSVAMVN